MTEWIDVKERLPATYTRCLVHTIYGGDRPVVESWYGSRGDGGEEGFWLGGVTHWMPLPDPPPARSGCVVADTGQDLRCPPGACPTPSECQSGGTTDSADVKQGQQRGTENGR
jgi:hypothetical protein